MPKSEDSVNPMHVKGKSNAQRELIWVAMALATGALCTAVYLTMQPLRDVLVYRITLLLLFFAISTISALMFATNANLSGNLKGLSLVVGGPSALWLIALVIFTKFYPEPDLNKFTLQSLAQEFWKNQQKDGWKDYANWKQDQVAFSEVLGKGESTTLQHLLWNVDFRSPGERLDQVEITTVFLYFAPKYTMKFQRITGKLSANSFMLNYGAQTSNATGTSGSVLLVGRNNGSLQVKESYFDGESGAEHLMQDEAYIDCLIVAWYDDEVTPDGDYITVDMKRFSTRHHGSLKLGVAAFKPMQDIRSWWLLQRVVTDEDELLPLAFREMHQPSQPDLLAVEGGLLPWLQVLDKAIDPDAHQIKEKARDMLQKAINTAGEIVGGKGHKIKPSAILADRVFKDRRSTSLPDSEDVVLSMFLWKQ
jgi:hypothetical protein